MSNDKFYEILKYNLWTILDNILNTDKSLRVTSTGRQDYGRDARTLETYYTGLYKGNRFTFIPYIGEGTRAQRDAEMEKITYRVHLESETDKWIATLQKKPNRKITFKLNPKSKIDNFMFSLLEDTIFKVSPITKIEKGRKK